MRDDGAFFRASLTLVLAQGRRTWVDSSGQSKIDVPRRYGFYHGAGRGLFVGTHHGNAGGCDLLHRP